MSIKVIRKTGWNGMGMFIDIKINGKKVARVIEKGESIIGLYEDSAKLQVTQLGLRSSEIEVKKGDIIEIQSTKWYRFSPLLFWILMIGTFMFTDMSQVTLIVAVFGVLTIISMFLFKSFKLNITNRKEDSTLD